MSWLTLDSLVWGSPQLCQSSTLFTALKAMSIHFPWGSQYDGSILQTYQPFPFKCLEVMQNLRQNAKCLLREF